MRKIEKNAVVEVINAAKVLYKRELTEFCGGNMSILKDGLIYITPTCASEYLFWNLQMEDIVVLSKEEDIIRGSQEQLSRETDLHALAYRNFPQYRSFFHLHCAELISLASGGKMIDTEIKDFLQKNHIGLIILETGLSAQTVEHNKRVVELIGEIQEMKTAIIVAPGHGVFSSAVDTAQNLQAVDSLTRFINKKNLISFLRSNKNHAD